MKPLKINGAAEQFCRYETGMKQNKMDLTQGHRITNAQSPRTRKAPGPGPAGF
jgi:hypothetical protein